MDRDACLCVTYLDGGSALRILRCTFCVDDGHCIHVPTLLHPVQVPSFFCMQVPESRSGGASLLSSFLKNLKDNLSVFLVVDLSPTGCLHPFVDELNKLDICSLLWRDSWRSLTVEDLLLNSLQAGAPCLLAKETLNTKQLTALLSRVLEGLPSELSPRQIGRLVVNFSDLYKRKTLFHASHVSHLRRGLTRLAEVSGAVRKLQEEKERSQRTVQERQEKAESTLQEVARAMVEAEERRKHAQALEAEARKEEEEQLEVSKTRREESLWSADERRSHSRRTAQPRCMAGVQFLRILTLSFSTQMLKHRGEPIFGRH